MISNNEINEAVSTMPDWALRLFKSPQVARMLSDIEEADTEESSDTQTAREYANNIGLRSSGEWL